MFIIAGVPAVARPQPSPLRSYQPAGRACLSERQLPRLSCGTVNRFNSATWQPAAAAEGGTWLVSVSRRADGGMVVSAVALRPF